MVELAEGETVLDLGSGGGIDVLLSAKRVGDTGTVYGLDMTDAMLALAQANAREAGACVVNLSPEKDRVLGRRRRAHARRGRRDARRDRPRAQGVDGLIGGRDVLAGRGSGE